MFFGDAVEIGVIVREYIILPFADCKKTLAPRKQILMGETGETGETEETGVSGITGTDLGMGTGTDKEGVT